MADEAYQSWWESRKQCADELEALLADPPKVRWPTAGEDAAMRNEHAKFPDPPKEKRK